MLLPQSEYVLSMIGNLISNIYVGVTWGFKAQASNI